MRFILVLIALVFAFALGSYQGRILPGADGCRTADLDDAFVLGAASVMFPSAPATEPGPPPVHRP